MILAEHSSGKWVSRMRTIIRFAMVVLLGSLAWSQSLTTNVAISGVYEGVDLNQGITQYDFTFTPGSFWPLERVIVVQFAGVPGTLQVITTKDGISHILAQSSDDACGTATGCTFRGHGKLDQTIVLVGDQKSARVSGMVKGTFADEYGVVHKGVSGRLYFETEIVPTGYSPDAPTTSEPAVLIIEVQ
jgi:hypothetical protein